MIKWTLISLDIFRIIFFRGFSEEVKTIQTVVE